MQELQEAGLGDLGKLKWSKIVKNLSKITAFIPGVGPIISTVLDSAAGVTAVKEEASAAKKAADAAKITADTGYYVAPDTVTTPTTPTAPAPASNVKKYLIIGGVVIAVVGTGYIIYRLTRKGR
jgi:hypothetical protein